MNMILLGLGGACSAAAYIIGYHYKKRVPLILGAIGLLMFIIVMLLNLIWS